MQYDEDKFLDTSFDNINFGSGVRKKDGMLYVCWPDGVCLKLQKDWGYSLTVEMIVMYSYVKDSKSMMISFLLG